MGILDDIGDAFAGKPFTAEPTPDTDAGHAVPFDAATTVDPGPTDGTSGMPGDLPAEPVEAEGLVAPPEPFEPAPGFEAAPDGAGLAGAAVEPIDEGPTWVDVLPEPEPEPVEADGAFGGEPDAVFEGGGDEAFIIDG